jgi:hypothetical protein
MDTSKKSTGGYRIIATPLIRIDLLSPDDPLVIATKKKWEERERQLRKRKEKSTKENE